MSVFAASWSKFRGLAHDIVVLRAILKSVKMFILSNPQSLKIWHYTVAVVPDKLVHEHYTEHMLYSCEFVTLGIAFSSVHNQQYAVPKAFALAVDDIHLYFYWTLLIDVYLYFYTTTSRVSTILL